MSEFKITKFKNCDFIVRKEIGSYLKKIMLSQPDKIIFFYGPKSSGKTTLLNYLKEEILNDKKLKNKITFFWYDLREQNLATYNKIMNLLLPVSKEPKGAVKIFNITKKENKKLLKGEIQPYQIINNKIDAQLAKSRRVIIIIDEIQTLKGIFTPENKSFLNELINYFIKITKVDHKANVILVTSDSYFIEELSNQSKSEASAEFIPLYFLTENEVKFWLSKYKFTNEEIEYIIENLGFNPWLISQIIQLKKLKEDWQNWIKNYTLKAKSKIITAVNKIEKTEFKNRVILFLKELAKNNGKLKIAFKNFEKDVLEFLIENEIIFYDPLNGKIEIQFKPYLKALTIIFEEYKGREASELFID